jgi:hypothetical protein
MTHANQESVDRDLLGALRRLADETIVPPADPAREAALLTAFDSARQQPPRSRGTWWWMAGLATAAAALLIGAGIEPYRGRPGKVHLLPSHLVVVGEFVPWPGARDLPPLESGELLRVDLPVSMLPALGMAPPATHGTQVKADVIIGQDGLARAVRLVAN